MQVTDRPGKASVVDIIGKYIHVQRIYTFSNIYIREMFGGLQMFHYMLKEIKMSIEIMIKTKTIK